MSPVLIRKESEFWSRQLDATSIEEKRAVPYSHLWSDSEREARAKESDRAADHFTLWDV